MSNKSRDLYFMQQALAQAVCAKDQQEVPVGAVLVYNDRIIAASYNQVEAQRDATRHAELAVLREGCYELGAKYLSHCTLYVTLEPCPMCAMACYWTQLGRLVIGASDEKRGYSMWAPDVIHPKTVVESGVKASSSTKLLQSFFQDLRMKKKKM